MSTPTDNINKSSFVRKEEPGFLENLGVKYYHYLGKKSGTAGLRNLTIDELPADVTLQTLAGNITAFAAIIAFAIGALTTFVTIWVEWTYQETMDSTTYYLGGAGSAVNDFLQAQRILMPVLNIGLPDSFVEQGTREELLALCGLDAQGIIAQAEAFCA